MPLAPDTYTTLAGASRYEPDKIKGSRFIACVAPATDETVAASFVDAVRAELDDARHVCHHNQGTGLLVASVIRDDVRVVGEDGLEQRCRKLGLGIIHGGENALRFTPHFGITDAEVEMMTDVLDEVLSSVE